MNVRTAFVLIVMTLAVLAAAVPLARDETLLAAAAPEGARAPAGATVGVR